MNKSKNKYNKKIIFNKNNLKNNIHNKIYKKSPYPFIKKNNINISSQSEYQNKLYTFLNNELNENNNIKNNNIDIDDNISKKLNNNINFFDFINSNIFKFKIKNKEYKVLHNLDFNEIEYKYNYNRLLDNKLNDIQFENNNLDIFLNNNAKRAIYNEQIDDNSLSTQMHYGQLKLYLSEIELLVDCCNLEEEYVIIYPGSAPGTHINDLLYYFPNIRFDLTDPRPFNQVIIQESEKKTDSRIKIRKNKNGTSEVFFTNELAKEIKKEYTKINRERKKQGLKEFKLILISDIRLPPNALYYIKDEWKQHYENLKKKNPLKNYTFSNIHENVKINILFEHLNLNNIYDFINLHMSKYATPIYNYIQLNKKDTKYSKEILLLFDIKKTKYYFILDRFKKLDKNIQSYILENLLWNNSLFEDLALQEKWPKLLGANYSLLKFRFPFGYNMDFKYLDGDIYLPIFGPKHTTECRLLIDATKHKYKYKKYDIINFEQRMTYFNLITRKQYYSHNICNLNNFDYCYDCSRMINIYDKFYEKYYKLNNTYYNNINDIDKYLNNNIIKNNDTKILFIKKMILLLIFNLSYNHNNKINSLMNSYIKKSSILYHRFKQLYYNKKNLQIQVKKLYNFLINH